jgi:Cys-rich repeat protein
VTETDRGEKAMSRRLHRTPYRRARALRPLGVLVLAAAASLPGCTPDAPANCTGGSGRDPDNCLGFRSNPAPAINGTIESEEWINSFRYVLGDGNGTSVPHAVAQGMRDSGNLYLSFEVNNDPTFDLDDAIVLAFDPDGSAANHRRIHIYPVFPAGADGSGAPQKVEYWKSSTPDWTSSSQAPVDPTPSWLLNNIRVTSLDSGSSKHWRVEVKIPIVAGANDPGINLPGNDDFGFYFSTLVVGTGFCSVTTSKHCTTNSDCPGGETCDTGTSRVAEESWPLNTNVGTFIEQTPAVGAWGNGVFGVVSNGVTISSTDITTDQVPDHHIEVDLPNTFRANVHNRTVNTSGAGVLARNVRVSFRLKNFGIPGVSPWDLVPTGNNPTPVHDIPAGVGAPPDGTFLFQTAPWNVPPALKAHYLANPNQCLRAELETTGADTLIVNKRAMRNTKFVDTASPFDEQAVVNTQGYPLPDGQRQLEFLLSEFRYNTKAEAPWSTELGGAQKLAERLYRLRAVAGPDAPLKARITPPDIAIPIERVTVPPGRPDAARKIAVQPGNIITIVAQGSLKRGDRTVGPNGADLTVRNEGAPGNESKRHRDQPAKGFPLPVQYSPQSQVGALVGSFDGFSRTAFPIGRATTFVVPAGAQTLNLGTNDTAEGWQQQSGDGFALEVIQTPPDDIYRYTSSLLPKRAPREVLFVPLGQNLPTWILCGQRRTGTTVTIHSNKYERYTNAGCFSYAVKSIGRTQPNPQ